MTIAHNHFYAGHGMSIGSGTQAGVSDITVHDLTIQGALEGLHIKSSANRGGFVRRVSYTDVYMQDVESPISFDTTYKGVTVGASFRSTKTSCYATFGSGMAVPSR